MVGVYTNEDLKNMQSMSLEDKIQVTKTRIIEWYVKNEGKVYISFSGGKDSTVLLHISQQEFPNITKVYIDTGLEYPEVKQFALSQPNVIKIKPDGKVAQKFVPNNPHDLKYGMGYSMVKWADLKESDIPISHKCCDIMKKNPAKKFEKEMGLKPITAMMACESNLRKNSWLKNGCNAFDSKRPLSNPMSFWTEQDVLEYIIKYNVPYASVYGDIVRDDKGNLKTTKCDRTGCVYCCYGIHNEKEPNRIQRLQQTHPKLWEYCMRDWDNGGLGLKRILDYLGVKTHLE